MRTRTNLYGWIWSVCFILSLIAGNAFGGGTWNLYDDFNTGSTVDPGKWAESTLFGSPIVSPTITSQKMAFDLSQEQLTIMRTSDAVKGIRAEIELTGDAVPWQASGGIALETDKYLAIATVTSDGGDIYLQFEIHEMSGGTITGVTPYRLSLPADLATIYDLALFHDGTNFWLAYQNRVVATNKGKAVLLPSTPVDSWALASSDGGSGTLEIFVDNVQLFNQTSAPVGFSASSQTVLVAEGGSTQFTVDLANPQLTPVTITPYRLATPSGDTISVMDEAHNLTDPGPTTISVSHITSGSVVITDSSGLTIYIEGVDYTINLLSDRLEIFRSPTGSISDGQAVLVDYQYLSDSSFLGDGDITISAAQTIDAGNTQATFTVSAAQDADWSNGRTTFELHLSNDSRILVTAIEVDDEHHHEWSVYDDFSGTSLDETKWAFVYNPSQFSLDGDNDRMLITSAPSSACLTEWTRTSNVWGVSANMSLSETTPTAQNAELSLKIETQAHGARVTLIQDGGQTNLYAAVYVRSNYRQICSAAIPGTFDQVYNANITFDGQDFWIEVDGVALLDSRRGNLPAGTVDRTCVEFGLGDSGSYTGYLDSVQVYQFAPPSAVLSPATPTNSNPIIVTALFNEPVTGFDDLATDVTISSGSVDNLVAVSSTEYTFELTPAGQGDITVTIVADAATAISDGRGNTSTSMVVTYDSIPPAAPTVASISVDTGSSSSDGVTTDQTLMIYGSSDPGTDSIEVFLDGSSIGTTTDVNSNGDWTFDYTGTSISEGAYDLTAEATDEAGNTGPASSAFTIDVDLTSPLVTVSTGATEPVSATFAVTATFNGDVTGLTIGNITVTNGTASNLVEVTPSQYTFDVTPSADGAVEIKVIADAVQDVAGNGNVESNTLSVTADLAPTVILTGPKTVLGTFTVTATFSESVSGLESGEISIVNGTALELTGSGTTYTVKVKPNKIGKVRISLPADCAQDGGGNGNEASNTLSVNYVILIPDDDDDNGCALGGGGNDSFLLLMVILLGIVTATRSGSSSRQK